MKKVFILCGLISIVISQQKPFNSRCLSDPTINPELCMKSFTNILADANRLKPKQNPGLAKFSSYLSDDINDVIQSIGEDKNTNDLSEILKRFAELEGERKFKKRIAISNNIAGENVRTIQEVKEINNPPQIDLSQFEPRKENEEQSKKNKVKNLEEAIPLFRFEKKDQKKKSTNSEEALRLLQLAMIKLGIDPSGTLTNEKKKETQEAKLKIIPNKSLAIKKSKDPLDELNALIKRLEKTLKKALRLVSKAKRKRIPKRIFRKMIQRLLKKAQALDNSIARRTVSDKSEITEADDRRKQSIRNAISLSQSEYFSKQKIRDLKSELRDALDATLKVKHLADEALTDDEAQDEPMSDFEADDEAALEIIKKIRTGNDLALTQEIKKLSLNDEIAGETNQNNNNQNRRLSLNNQIEGVNVQTSQQVKEENNRRLAVSNSIKGTNVQTKLDAKEENFNLPEKNPAYGKLLKNLASQNSISKENPKSKEVSSQTGAVNKKSPNIIQKINGRRANINSQSRIQQIGGNNKNDQSKIQQIDGGRNDKYEQNKVHKIDGGGSNKNKQSNVQQIDGGGSNKSEKIKAPGKPKGSNELEYCND